MAGTHNLLEYLEGVLLPSEIQEIKEGWNETDVTIHVQAVFDEAAADLQNDTKGTVIVPAGRYWIEGIVILPKDVHLLMEGFFYYAGNDDVPILEVGEAGENNRKVQLRLAVEREQQSDWQSEDNIGIKLINCDECDINIVRADYNTIGLQCIGMGSAPDSIYRGFMYNNIRLGMVLNNKIGVHCGRESVDIINGDNPEVKLRGIHTSRFNKAVGTYA